MAFIRALLSDLVKLKLPVTAAAVLATFVALAEPFGIALGGDTTAKVTAALIAIGVIAAYIQSKLGGVKVETNPATFESAPTPGLQTFRTGGIVPAPGTVSADPDTPVQPRAPGDTA